MECYLDNSATTKVLDEVKDIVVEAMTTRYGNPSSMHTRGVDAEKYIRNTKKILAGILHCKENEIIFTSGGTESNNLALIGAAMANRRAGNHIITSMIEHASVSNPLKYLEKQGFEITEIGVDEKGVLDTEALEAAIRPETILISVMFVNNEIGTIQPIERIAEIIKRKKPDILFHVDAIQAFGKVEIRPSRMGIDMLSVSGHKIHAPKGTGFLYVKSGTKLAPVILGGEQQGGMRSGTENVPGIAGLGVAAGYLYKNFDSIHARMSELRKQLILELTSIEGVSVNGCLDEGSAVHIVSASFAGVRSEVLLHALEDKGIYVSAGSACSSNHPSPSRTLTAIGLPSQLIESTLRFSMSMFTTEDEIRYTGQTLRDLLPVLRRFTRK